MKKLLILLFSFLISFNSYGETGCSEKEENDGPFAIHSLYSGNMFWGADFINSTVFFQKRNGLFFLPNESKPYSGENLCVFKNTSGQIHLKGDIKNGKKHGKYTIWLENGGKFQEVTFKEGAFHGEFVIFDPDSGQKRAQGKMKKTEYGSFWDGKLTTWDNNGKVQTEVIFQDEECIEGDCEKLGY